MNLITHLRINHAKDYTTMMQQSIEGSNSKATSNKASDPSQRQLKDSFAAHTLLPHNNVRWKKLTDTVCYYIAKDMQPLDTIGSE